MIFKMLHSKRAAPWIALALSGGLLGGAWVFQYGFGYLPCQMCYWQRHAHKAVLVLAALWLILRSAGVEAAEILRWAVTCALLVSFGLAAWHVRGPCDLHGGRNLCARCRCG
jgi:disulfide bond formation protein DsbB